jgi:hypothetical protein
MGAGGQWAGHIIRLMEDNNFTLVPGNINFHSRPQSKYFHFDHNESHGKKQNEFLLGTKHKFNLFLNSHAKFYIQTNYKNFNSMSVTERLFELSNHARWHHSDDYVDFYETDIDLNYDNIIKDPAAFQNQLITVLEHNWPQEYLPRVTESFVTQACEIFSRTVINPADHLGNVDSMSWLGWFHAMCQIKNIDPGIDISKNFNCYQDWVSHNQKTIIEATMPFVLT